MPTYLHCHKTSGTGGIPSTVTHIPHLISRPKPAWQVMTASSNEDVMPAGGWYLPGPAWACQVDIGPASGRGGPHWDSTTMGVVAPLLPVAPLPRGLPGMRAGPPLPDIHSGPQVVYPSPPFSLPPDSCMCGVGLRAALSIRPTTGGGTIYALPRRGPALPLPQ